MFVSEAPPTILIEPPTSATELPVFTLIVPVEAAVDLPVATRIAPVFKAAPAVWIFTCPDVPCVLNPETRFKLPPVVVSERPASRVIDAPCVPTLVPVVTTIFPTVPTDALPV